MKNSNAVFIATLLILLIAYTYVSQKAPEVKNNLPEIQTATPDSKTSFQAVSVSTKNANLSCLENASNVLIRSCSVSTPSESELGFAVLTFIPKSIAENTDNMLIPPDSKILQSDPVILTYLKASAGKTQKISYVMPMKQDAVKERPVSILIDLTGTKNLSEGEEAMLIGIFSSIGNQLIDEEKAKKMQEQATKIFSEGVSEKSAEELKNAFEQLGVYSESIEVLVADWRNLTAYSKISAPFCEKELLNSPAMLFKFDGGSARFFSFGQNDCSVTFSAHSEEKETPDLVPEFYETTLTAKDIKTGKEWKVLVHVAVDREDVE